MSFLPFTLGPALGYKANLGLIVLRTDETIEADFRQLVADDGIALYTARIPCETELTEEALGRMKATLPAAAALLPHTFKYDVVGYACTSASAVIGSDAVGCAIRAGTKARHVTDPLLAIRAALGALKVRKIGFLSPYVAELSDRMRQVFEADGIEIASFGTFGEESDESIARIDTTSIQDAARRICEAALCEALLISCTNLRATTEIAQLEAEVGLPVLTSNQALAWHMLKLSGQRTDQLAYGALKKL